MSAKKFKLFGSDTFLNKFVYGLAVVMFATVIFIYFGAQNTGEISVRTTVIFSSLLFVLSILTYIISLIIFRRAFAAFVFCMICWLDFYSINFIFYSVHVWLTQWISSREDQAIFITIIALIIAFTAALIVRKNKSVKPTKAIYMFIGVLAVIFIINSGILIRSSMQEAEAFNTRLPIKTNFKLDNHTPPPPLHLIFTGSTQTAC